MWDAWTQIPMTCDEFATEATMFFFAKTSQKKVTVYMHRGPENYKIKPANSQKRFVLSKHIGFLFHFL
jgi:hypothetical protein